MVIGAILTLISSRHVLSLFCALSPPFVGISFSLCQWNNFEEVFFNLKIFGQVMLLIKLCSIDGSISQFHLEIHKQISLR